MKALLAILVLVAIVFAYIFSTTLYVQGNLLSAYSLILASLATLVLWIRSIDLTKMLAKA
jgi:hypothetical protein